MEEQKVKARARDKTRIFGGATAVGRLELGQVDIFSMLSICCLEFGFIETVRLIGFTSSSRQKSNNNMVRGKSYSIEF